MTDQRFILDPKTCTVYNLIQGEGANRISTDDLYGAAANLRHMAPAVYHADPCFPGRQLDTLHDLGLIEYLGAAPYFDEGVALTHTGRRAVVEAY